MTGRERIMRALAHQESDRAPYDQSSRSSAIEVESYDALKAYLGMETPTKCFIRAHAEMEEPIRQLLGIDTEFVRHMPAECWTTEGSDDLFVDAWDVPWRRRQGASYYELDTNPFASLEYDQILQQEWKPLVSEETARLVRDQAAKSYHEHDSALFSDQIGAGLFERAWYLRGFEQMLMDMMLEKRHVHRYMEKILEHQIQGYATLFDAVGEYTLGVLLTDDLATQDSLIFSKELYREMVFPYQKQLLDYIRSRGQVVIFHSCGAVYPLIPDLLEAGVEILHPIQSSASGMDPGRIKQEYGKDLVLWGAGCDTALLQSNTPSMIVAEVQRTMDSLAKDGGFVFTTTHCIQPGTPPENILAMSGAIQGENQPKGHEADWIRKKMSRIIQETR
ncbi:MAG: uroporphyrinogen decarboxylase family protein [Sphaerochaeta sp.]|nr:uroporphyrinogen decarboxylase family protein [Sphaerochaeta sp.]